jgi:glycosyltransferase involved in cell wall biosynthesis
VHERHSLDPGVWPALKRLVAEARIDIVHAHEYKTDLLAWLLARRTGIAPLSTAHGWTGQSARERLVYYPADKRLLARFPRVIAVSTEIRDELVRHGARPDRITVILNAIDPSQFRRVADKHRLPRTQLGIAPDEVVAGAVGRLERQKRFDLLIEAVAALAPAWPRLRLVIAGDGSLRGALQAQVDRLGLAGICRFLGHRTDVTDLHHAFDLFVQSSEYEGTPNAVLEAMAMETPLVATDAGGHAGDRMARRAWSRRADSGRDGAPERHRSGAPRFRRPLAPGRPRRARASRPTCRSRRGRASSRPSMTHS